MLDVPKNLVTYVTGLPRAGRRVRGTRTGIRILTCRSQAISVLPWFRNRPNVTRRGQGFGISQATSYRYLCKSIAKLQACPGAGPYVAHL